MSRLARKNRTNGDIGILSSGGIMDLFDNQLKSCFRISDAEYDYLCDVMSDDEIGIMVDEATTFKQKRLMLTMIEGYLDKYKNKGTYRTFRFYKEKTETGKKWYVDFPEWKGDKWELEMVLGADKMLDIIAGPGKREVFLRLSDKPFILEDTEPIKTQAFKLEKIADTPTEGGAIYFLKEWYGVEHNLELWLCHVTAYVFGHLPQTIYIA